MRIRIVSVVVVCFFTTLVFSQTADELVNKNIQAKGGIDKIKAIKSVRMTGRLTGSGGFTADVGQESQRPNLHPPDFHSAGIDRGPGL